MTAARAILDHAISEQAFQRLVVECAEWNGWWWWHDEDSRRNARGLPDLLLVRDRCIWLELKKERGRIRPAQIEVMERLRAAGAEVYLFRPSDWPEIEAVLRR